MSTWVFDRAIQIFILCVLLFSPLPFGSVEVWFRNFFQLLIFVSVIVWVFQLLSKNPQISQVKDGLEEANSSKSHWFLMAFISICLLQIVPLPGFILTLLSHKSLEIWVTNNELIASFGLAPDGLFHTISLYPHATWEKTVVVLSYFGFGFIVAKHIRTRNRIVFFLIVVFAIAFLESVVGLMQYLGNLGGQSEEGTGSFARGTFFNKNHFAGFLEMTLPLVLGYTLSLGGQIEGEKRSWKQLISSDNLPRQMTMVVLMGLMMLALILSKSRSGIVSIVLALIFFFVITRIQGHGRGHGSGRGLIILLVVFFAAMLGLWIGVYPVFENFLRAEGDAAGRILVWKDSLGLIADFPIFGSGLGTFSVVYPLYRESMDLPVVYNYAHNDYLQIITETGLLGFICLMGALLTFFMTVFKKILNYKGHYGSLRLNIALGALTGVVSILLHSVTDFNLHIPSNGFYFAFLVGLIAAVLGPYETDSGAKSAKSQKRISPDRQS